MVLTLLLLLMVKAETGKGFPVMTKVSLLFEQPFIAVITTLYMVVIIGDTVIEESVCPPGLHKRFPGAVVESTELPQLLTTFTTGVVGIVKGAAIPEPTKLVHPPEVCVTV